MFEFQCSRNNKNLPAEDDYGFGFRMIHSFLKMCSIVREIKSASDRLFDDNDYKKFLKRQKDFLRKEMDELKNNLISSIELIKDVRDNIGSHVLEVAVRKALKNMDHIRHGDLVIPDNFAPKQTHYKFTGELIIAMLIRDASPEHQWEEAEQIVLALTGSLDKLFHRIDLLFFCYIHDRKLLKIDIGNTSTVS
jgi:hypothetical protein